MTKNESFSPPVHRTIFTHSHHNEVSLILNHQRNNNAPEDEMERAAVVIWMIMCMETM